jgi:hypothetical protein
MHIMSQYEYKHYSYLVTCVYKNSSMHGHMHLSNNDDHNEFAVHEQRTHTIVGKPSVVASSMEARRYARQQLNTAV